MIELKVEEYLRKRVKETGGECRKVVWPAHNGAPDRLCGWPKTKRAAFVETKRPKGGNVAAHQEREHARLRSCGLRVDVVLTKEEVDAFIEDMAK